MNTVIITRPEASVALSSEIYQNQGFKVFEAPCFSIKTNESLPAQWLEVATEVWVILSVHALQHALVIAPALKPGNNTQVIAVGPAVEQAWKQHFDHDIIYHPWMNSEGVIELLKGIEPTSVKILTTDGGRSLIKSHCMKQCISYAQLNTYLRTPLTVDQVGLLNVYQNKVSSQPVLTITSCGILTELMSQLTTELAELVLAKPIVVGAQRIADLANELGFLDIHLASSPSDQAMCDAVKKLN